MNTAEAREADEILREHLLIVACHWPGMIPINNEADAPTKDNMTDITRAKRKDRYAANPLTNC